MKWPLYLILVTMLLVTTSVWAQTSPATPPTLAVPSLTGALLAATPPTNGVALAVQAETVQTAPNAAPLEPHASITQVGDAYGRMVRRFGNVTAVAPPTMIVFNDHPSQPNIYADLQPSETAKLLAASLSPSQWQALTSERGMGLSDLSDDSQRQMFMALFPEGKLQFYTDGENQNGSQDLSQELPEARLRLYRKTMIFLPLQGNTNESISMQVSSQPGQPKTYNITRDYNAKETEFGIPVRAEQPNALKPSDLDYNSGAVHVPIALPGLKTVGDLISRIARQTHLELYADPRYAGQSLTIVGKLPAAYASDLLRALSLCLTGTWRQVGPAFVLTFDEIGLGTTRQIWQRLEQQAQDLKRGPLDAAGDKIITAHSSQDLNAFGDPLAVTPAQQAAWKKDNPDNASYSGTPYMNIAVSQLTPAQQANVQAMNDAMTKNPANDGHGNRLPDISSKIGVEAIPTLQLLLPSLDGPITMDQINDLFQPSSKLQQQLWAKQNASQPNPSPEVPPAAPHLAVVMAPIPRRAVFATPKTPTDIAAIVGSMKTLGFNQLWVTVFSEGQSHPELLTAALKATKGSGIAVFPVLNLLRWGLDAPPEAQDLTLLGETSAQTEKENQQEQNADSSAAGGTPSPTSAPTTLLVTPASPQVEGRLANFVHYYGTHPGVTGLIWTDTAAIGYSSRNVPYRQQAFGYALSARLAFLRRYQADPIDLGDTPQADTSVSNFSDYQAEEKLGKQWQQYLSTADHTLLKHLYTAARGSALLPQIFMPNQNQDFGNPWYGSWDGPNSPVPAYHGWDESNNQQPPQPVAQAKSESKVALITIPYWKEMTPDRLALQLTDLFKTDHWDGFVMAVGDGKDFAKLGVQKGLSPIPQRAK